MSKSKVEMSFLTKELLINGEEATMDVLIALMQHMNLKREDNPRFYYHVEGLGELCFTADKHLAEERKEKYLASPSTTVLNTNNTGGGNN